MMLMIKSKPTHSLNSLNFPKLCYAHTTTTRCLHIHSAKAHMGYILTVCTVPFSNCLDIMSLQYLKHFNSNSRIVFIFIFILFLFFHSVSFLHCINKQDDTSVSVKVQSTVISLPFVLVLHNIRLNHCCFLLQYTQNVLLDGCSN